MWKHPMIQCNKGQWEKKLIQFSKTRLWILLIFHKETNPYLQSGPIQVKQWGKQ